jgi:two-component system CheB/CheR fusion protein
MSALRLLSEATSSAYPIDCRFNCPQPVLVENNQIAVHLYRIAQEAVTNAAKHGHPSRISILLGTTDDGLTLSVTDDGTGFVRKESGSEGIGLRIMRYRAAAIGASFRVENAPGGGTSITCILADSSGKGASKVRA